MSSYFCLGLALASGVAGIIYNYPPLHVICAVWVVGAVIIARLDTVIALLRANQ